MKDLPFFLLLRIVKKSTRGPEQVFMLLQTVYQSFDIVAKRHKVFKVETIGDCYVAATGLPGKYK